MTRQVILLAGLHKTATTTIQRACIQHQEELMRAGFIVRLTTKGEALNANYTNLLRAMFRRNPQLWGLADEPRGAPTPPEVLALQEEKRREFSDQLKRAKRDMLILAEGASMFSAQELQTMRDWIGEHGWTVRVLCHVRHLGSWIHSATAQRVVSGPRLPIQGVIQEMAAVNGIVKPRIENLRIAFPDAEFSSYEEVIRHPGGPAGYFFEAIGAGIPANLESLRANEGGTDAGVRAASIINEKFEGRELPSGKPKERLLNALKQIGKGKFVLRRREVEPILPLLHAENAWLKDAFGSAFHDENLTFHTDEPAWRPEDLAAIDQILRLEDGEVRGWMRSRLREHTH